MSTIYTHIRVYKHTFPIFLTFRMTRLWHSAHISVSLCTYHSQSNGFSFLYYNCVCVYVCDGFCANFPPSLFKHNFPRAQIYPWVCLHLFLHSEIRRKNAVKQKTFFWTEFLSSFIGKVTCCGAIPFYRLSFWGSGVLNLIFWKEKYREKKNVVYGIVLYVEMAVCCAYISINICVCLLNWIERFSFALMFTGFRVLVFGFSIFFFFSEGEIVSI